MESSNSSSPLAEIYGTPEFQNAWDNEISFHLAQHAIELRRFRDLSQQDVAAGMNTSQSAVARIESGDENITLRTLRRLVDALDGRLQFAIEPKEFAFPRLPPWWEVLGRGLVSKSVWTLHATAFSGTDGSKRAVAAWSTEQQIAGKVIQMTGAPSPMQLVEPRVA